MLEHKNIIIFSPPRSGTKLLASILEGFGYYSHGEWFALLTTEIKNNRAVRKEDLLKPIWPLPYRQFKNLKEHIRRYRLYKKEDRSVITIWPEFLLEFPFILEEFSDYHWVCIRRDPWQQMLSWFVSSVNTNFDGLKTSVKVTVDVLFFTKTYWDYHKICGLQDWLIENKSATLVDFDELIAGASSAIKQSYIVRTKDEHIDLESLIENLEEVKIWYQKSETIRLSN